MAEKLSLAIVKEVMMAMKADGEKSQKNVKVETIQEIQAVFEEGHNVS